MSDFHGVSADSIVDAFCIAASGSKLKEMKALLADGVDIDGLSANGFTALASATRLGLTRSVQFLLDNGADVDRPSWEDLTPLLFACSAGKAKGSKIALQLIEHGANVSYVRESDGMTALKFAVHEAKPEVIQALIDKGAEIDGPAGTDQTALMIAARANNVDALRLLVEAGADLQRPCKLPWAEGRNALGLAEFEKNRKATKYLREVTPGES